MNEAMEMLSTLILFILVAIGITAIFSLSFRTRGPWGSGWSFFFIIFLFVWASSIWIKPYGPEYNGLAWGPILFVGFLVAFLLYAATPIRYRKWKNKKADKPDDPDTVSFNLAIDIFFWMVIAILLIAILISYW